MYVISNPEDYGAPRMLIRKTTPADIAAVVAVFDSARAFMREQGNPTQWAGVYPSAANVEADIAQGSSYVFEDAARVVGTFAFVLGDEPMYQVIDDGAWRSSQPYGTIHRIASDGTARGLARACFDFCAEHMPYLRIDTHANNSPMQQAILKYGFKRCGIVYMSDGDPRIAFDWLRE